MPKKAEGCPHPPMRYYSWFAVDGTLGIGCCACGVVVAGAVDGTPASADVRGVVGVLGKRKGRMVEERLGDGVVRLSWEE